MGNKIAKKKQFLGEVKPSESEDYIYRDEHKSVCKYCGEKFMLDKHDDGYLLYWSDKSHMKSCREYWKKSYVHENYHIWCHKKSIDRYNVWLLNKKTLACFFYSINQIHKNNKKFGKIYYYNTSLRKIKSNLLCSKQSDPIYENEDIIIYIKYANILTDRDKFSLRQSLLRFIGETDKISTMPQY